MRLLLLTLLMISAVAASAAPLGECILLPDDAKITVQNASESLSLVYPSGTRANVDGGMDVADKIVLANLTGGTNPDAALCASRRYLFDHMDDSARMSFVQAFAECGLLD